MTNKIQNHSDSGLLAVIYKLWALIVFLIVVIGALLYVLWFGFPHVKAEAAPERDASSFSVAKKQDGVLAWSAPDTSSIPDDAKGLQIRYGRALIAQTASYLGPKGTVANISNGMNCQNCHLEAGTKPYGNNYSAVASTYPKFRERSGAIENICKRVNDCIERSLNGYALDSASAEMKAIEAYIHWLGKDVKKGLKPIGSGIEDLPFLNRAADPSLGANIFKAKCISCHGADGQGKMIASGITYQYPPLWGPHSYNTGAGLYRLTRFAGYIKNNMPQGASKALPQLSNEEAWDIAAYVNSQDRPKGNISKDWPRLAAKPIDNPFGPYADGFSEGQHKYGPYAEIAEYKKKHKDSAPNTVNPHQKK
jgi:thiosulfate dehydrogenase